MVQIPIYTIGHGNRSIDDFISLLRQYQILYVVDIRSQPYSRYVPHFSKSPLEQALHIHDLYYLYLGDTLGGRPKDQTCYINEKLDYSLVREKNWYLQGIQRLHTAWGKQLPVVLLCSELKPQECHRGKLIGNTLFEQGIPVAHIDEAGKLKDQETLNLLLTSSQPTLFEELSSNQSLRLLTKLGTHQPYDSPFEIGQIWELSWKREYHPQPPHVEDVRVLEQRFIGVQDFLRTILLQRVHPWIGSPEQLFNGYIVLKGTSAYICRSAGLPTCSTGFWLPGKKLVLSPGKTRPYYTLMYETSSRSSAQLRIPFVGCADPIPEIPAEALIRVSLARWWKKTEEEEKKCYLQLSGWYL